MQRDLIPRMPTEVSERFAAYDRLTVRQRKRWGEILLSFEFRNHYDVYDQRQSPVLQVQEEGQGFLAFLKRLFLGPLRPFHATVSDVATGAPALRLHRPFRFVFHRLEVRSGYGQLLGAVQRRWAWLRRLYVLEGPDGQPVAELFGPILRPWTFEVQVNGRSLGVIQKRWSGFLKEAFTDADNFGVSFGAVQEPRLKALAFAATVLIDVVHFERAKGG